MTETIPMSKTTARKARHLATCIGSSGVDEIIGSALDEVTPAPDLDELTTKAFTAIEAVTDEMKRLSKEPDTDHAIRRRTALHFLKLAMRQFELEMELIDTIEPLRLAHAGKEVPAYPQILDRDISTNIATAMLEFDEKDKPF